jgi:exosortase family protein XrtM
MEGALPLKSFIRSYKKESKFFILFIVFFILGQALHYIVYPYTAPLLVHKLNAEVSSRIINIITPKEKSYVEDRTIRSEDFRVKIIRGCEGTEGMIILAAAIWAFEMSIRRKIIGSLAGCFTVYLANLTRIIVLYYCLKYKPDIFDVVHIYVGQIFIIFIALLFFILWISTYTGIHGRSEQKV